jgi:hypothetical protein
MSLWLWILVASGAPLALSLFVGLGLAAILGRISSEVSGLLEVEHWSGAPLTAARALAAPASRHGSAHA